MGFGVRAAGAELKAVVRPALLEAFRDDLGVGFQDDGEVGPVSFGVELPQEGGINAVEPLHHQT